MSTNDAWEAVASQLSTRRVHDLPKAVAETPEVLTGWHLVVVPEEEAPKCETFETTEQLRRAVKNYADKEARVFVFAGSRLFTTAPPNPCLVLANGDILPLYDVEEELVYATDGKLYVVDELPEPESELLEFVENNSPESRYEDDEPDGEEDGAISWD